MTIGRVLRRGRNKSASASQSDRSRKGCGMDKEAGPNAGAGRLVSQNASLRCLMFVRYIYTAYMLATHMRPICSLHI